MAAEAPRSAGEGIEEASALACRVAGAGEGEHEDVEEREASVKKGEGVKSDGDEADGAQ